MAVSGAPPLGGFFRGFLGKIRPFSPSEGGKKKKTGGPFPFFSISGRGLFFFFSAGGGTGGGIFFGGGLFFVSGFFFRGKKCFLKCPRGVLFFFFPPPRAVRLGGPEGGEIPFFYGGKKPGKKLVLGGAQREK